MDERSLRTVRIKNGDDKMSLLPYVEEPILQQKKATKEIPNVTFHFYDCKGCQVPWKRHFKFQRSSMSLKENCKAKTIF